MGWNNVVDFIQDGFENIAREAGLSPISNGEDGGAKSNAFP